MTDTDLIALDAGIDFLCHQLHLNGFCAAEVKRRARSPAPLDTPLAAVANGLACQISWGDAGYRFLDAAEPFFEALLGDGELTHELMRKLADTGNSGALVVGRLSAHPRPVRSPHPDRHAIALEVVQTRIRELGARLGLEAGTIETACYRAGTAHMTRFTPSQRAAHVLAAATERLRYRHYFPHSDWERSVSDIFTGFLEGRAATEEQLLALKEYGHLGGLVSIHLATPPSAPSVVPAKPPQPKRNRVRTP
jgi:hypothetical protein